MSEVEIFGFGGSTYVQTTLAIAAEKGAACVLRPVEFGAASHLALHPFAKMPVMRHGSICLFETLAIAVYLDETFEGSALQPKSAVDRAIVFQWISASIDYLYPALVRATLADHKGGEAGAKERERCLAILSGALAGRSYLAGGALTLADLFVAPMLAFMAGQLGGAGKALAGNAHLAGWLDRVTRRESFGGLAAA